VLFYPSIHPSIQGFNVAQADLKLEVLLPQILSIGITRHVPNCLAVCLHFDCNSSYEVKSGIFYLWHCVSSQEISDFGAFCIGDIHFVLHYYQIIFIHITFVETARLVFKTAALFYIPSAVYKGSNFLSTFTISIMAILVGEKWYPVILIHISLKTNNTGLRVICLFAWWYEFEPRALCFSSQALYLLSHVSSIVGRLKSHWEKYLYRYITF
jgi:hypothetical protein